MRLATLWLMDSAAHARMSALATGFTPTEDTIKLFIERRTAGRGAGYFVDDEGVAHIPIVGMMTKEPDIFADLFGGGSAVYGDLIAAVHDAEADPKVKGRGVLEIVSPRGTADGFLDFAEAVRDSTLALDAEVTDLCTSAAYGVATQCRSIRVNGAMAHVGSVGVVIDQFVSDQVVTIRSTDAPAKNPDASTSEGERLIRAQLDEIHNVFADLIAKGRGVPRATVDRNFGRGAMVIASKALAAGMIDGIAAANVVDSTEIEVTPEGELVDIAELKAKFPGIYNEARAEGHAAGLTEGTTVERERCQAHLTMAGKHSIELATKYISEGAAFGAVQTAEYLAAGAKAAETTDRATDDAAGGAEGDPGTEGDPKGGKGGGAELTADQVSEAAFQHIDDSRGAHSRSTGAKL